MRFPKKETTKRTHKTSSRKRRGEIGNVNVEENEFLWSADATADRARIYCRAKNNLIMVINVYGMGRTLARNEKK